MEKLVNQLPRIFFVEDLVDNAKSYFLKYCVGIVLTNLVIWYPWLGLPIIRTILEMFLNVLFKILIDKGELGAFIINTKVLTSQQAYDYRQSIYKVALAKTDEELEAAERLANEKFIDLIRFTS
jgi:hypothetical protein